MGVLCEPKGVTGRHRLVYYLAFVLFASVPDFRLENWGHHRYDVSHSVFVNLLIIGIGVVFLSLCGAVRTSIGGWKVVVGEAIAWLSQLLLDSFYNHGRGIGIFWPFSSARLALPIPWFTAVTPDLRLTAQAAREYLTELVFYSALLLVAIGLRRTRAGRRVVSGDL